MVTFIKSATFDCADALVAARFSAAALDGDLDGDSTSDKACVEAPGWGGANLWFQRVPEPRTVKNRLHFDLRAPDPVADEVRRLTAIGATVARESEDITVMRDPEGNEFCVERWPRRWARAPSPARRDPLLESIRAVASLASARAAR